LKKLPFRLAAAIAFFAMLGVANADERRVALVLGVADYKHSGRLANTLADAKGMAAALERVGFQVETVLDPDRKALEDAVRRLGQRAQGADASLFYYAGHAVEVSGRNWLVPAPADIQSIYDLRFEALDLDSIIEQVSGRSRVALFFMDSCRDNPFHTRLAAGTRGVSMRGLGRVDAAAGTLIAFATAPGRVAADGTTGNSPFTAALLRHIERPGVEVRRLMADVRREVREATEGKQLPWENSALEGDFYLSPLVVAAAAEPKFSGQTPPVAARKAADTAVLRPTLLARLGAALPKVAAEQHEDHARRYEQAKPHKALAFSMASSSTWRGVGQESAASAEQGALEACQLRLRPSLCFARHQ